MANNSKSFRAGIWPGMRDFKFAQCNENELIAEVLRGSCRPWLTPTILDVGAGLGDIALAAFPDMSAVLLDNHQKPDTISPCHTYVDEDFYNYDPAPLARPQTILLSHVMQYLDTDWRRFRAHIDRLGPKHIIAVTNDNDGEFGEIVSWGAQNMICVNPEYSALELNETKYRLAKAVPFSAKLRCGSFETLALQLTIGIFDAPITGDNCKLLLRHLKDMLAVPELTINETVYCYERR